MVFSDAYVIIRIRNNPKGRCNMKYSFVKDFPGIGACDAYVGAIVSGKKEKKNGCIVCELLAAVDEKRFSGKEGQLFSANLFHEGKLMT